MTISQFAISINDLPATQFIGGTQQFFEFNIYDQVTGSPIDLSSCTVRWALSPMGQPTYVALLKTGVKTGGSLINQYTVTLNNADTSGSYGMYIQQPIIIDFGGNEFRPSQGIVTIIPANR